MKRKNLELTLKLDLKLLLENKQALAIVVKLSRNRIVKKRSLEIYFQAPLYSLNHYAAGKASEATRNFFVSEWKLSKAFSPIKNGQK